MPLLHPSLALEIESVALTAAAVLVPLLVGSLVYADARRRRESPRSRGASLTPLAWGATAFFSGVGCVVVAACYLVVQSR